MHTASTFHTVKTARNFKLKFKEHKKIFRNRWSNPHIHSFYYEILLEYLLYNPYYSNKMFEKQTSLQ